MLIKYAPFHRWYKPVVEHPEALFSAKNKKRILSSLPRIAADNTITYEIVPLNTAFLDWFVPFYTEIIGNRKNPVIHDIYSSTLGNPEPLSEYWSLTIKQDGRILGGTILGLRSDRIMIAYKAYEPKWAAGTYQATPTLFSEYITATHAYSLGKKLISHGKDRNPYGLNAAIGLATFKLSVGYTASILTEHEDYSEARIDTDHVTEDILVLKFPDSGTTITEAVLLTKDVNHPYAQVTTYPDQLRVTVLLRD